MVASGARVLVEAPAADARRRLGEAKIVFLALFALPSLFVASITRPPTLRPSFDSMTSPRRFCHRTRGGLPYPPSRHPLTPWTHPLGITHFRQDFTVHTPLMHLFV
ncbi:hypothetical protein Y032_0236g3237 [Ancylostoma ceylanicum]|uniref:Uncharacterized protein n=1 Tax=Ancylostoma ceylanicum TaxID=53326 RepID=A0A016SFQ6_9BILA|nr:hypothetical protein Y032_0236g3237 [Ancylostoma ceylanicum]